MFWAVWALLMVLLLWAFLVAPGGGGKGKRAPFINRAFAHRGLYDPASGLPENSLPAFQAAVEAGYGVELDVQLSKDGQVVVFHDLDLMRACQMPGRADQYTYDQLRSMPLMGTEQRIPLFSEVLETLDGRVPAIVELKPGGDWKTLCRKTRDMLRAYEGDYCVESFHPLLVRWFWLNAPEILRGQLSEAFRFSRKGLAFPLALMMSRCLTNCLTHPQFIAYGTGPKCLSVRLSQALGAMRVAWTAQPEDDWDALVKENDAIIFEGWKPPLYLNSNQAEGPQGSKS